MSRQVIKNVAPSFKPHKVNAFYSTLISLLVSKTSSQTGLQNRKGSTIRRRTWLLTAFTLLINFGAVARAQQSGYEHTKDKVDQTLRSNARVNPSTLAVELSIPIADLAGRGGAGMPLVLNYSSKVWELRPTGLKYGSSQFQEEVRPMYSDDATAGWTSSYDVPTIDTVVESYNCYGGATDTNNIAPPNCYNTFYYVKRIRIKLPGGTTHELRKDDLIYENPYGVMDTTGTFYAVDGSRVRLEWGTAGESTLFMPDGGRYFFADNGNNPPRCYKYIDRNGNTLTYDSTARAWTDTMGRTLSSPRQPNQAEGTQNYNVPGLNNTTRQYQFVWKKLSTGALLAGESLSYVTRNCVIGAPPRSPLLFTSTMAIMPCDGTNGYFDPVVLNQIILPNGQKYKFSYNTFGEIVRIDYPTGAYEKFVYAQITGLGWDYQRNYTTAVSYGKANRGVIERYVGADGVTGEQHWHYSAGYQTTTTYGADTYVMETIAPDNTRSKRFLHRTVRPPFADEPVGNYGFETILAGREMETQTLDSAGTIRSRALFEWETTNAGAVGYTNAVPQRDARLKRQVSIIIEPGAGSGLASMSASGYDSNADLGHFAALNAKQVKTYKYKVLDLATAQTATLETIATQFTASDVQSIAETDYLYDAAYKDRGIVGLPIEQRVMNPASPTNLIAKSQISYDEAAYPVLTYGTTTTGWEDPGITARRGLVTTTRAWNSSANAGAGGWIEAHLQYDQFGNVRKSWDARGNLSEIEYSPSYNYAYPTTAYSPDPSGANNPANRFITATTFDFNTGLATKTIDANGLETRMEYADPLLRPTSVSNYFAGQQVGAALETVYGAPDATGQLPATQRFVKVRSQIDQNNWAESLSWFDGLGRTVKTQKKDTSGDVFGFVCYDQMGRVVKSSNPYRGAEPANVCGSTQTNLLWTTNVFDASGRVTETVMPMEAGQTVPAKVLTSYELATTAGSQIGTVVTVTDQAGKQRRSITNALGQLTRVDEPTATGLGSLATPNQPTVYSYDALSNLSTVVQAGQTRTFVYDSLSRLKSAANPESGLISYSYDAAGNLLAKTDARNITTSYVYDALNRVVNRTYTDGATPRVDYYYDGKYFNSGGAEQTATGAVKGKLTSVKTNTAPNLSYSNYTMFDQLGRIKSSQQITDGQTYNFADYSYNLAGALVSQTYPSGRQIRNILDADGDLSAVSSRTKQTNPLRSYASNFSYTAAGAVSAMQLGNGRWETTQFNNRLQPVQLGLGTTNNPNNADLWKATFDYGLSDNNGNVKSQTIVVPNTTVGGTTYNGFTATQTYTYDSLNRLQDAKEMIGAQTWKQTYSYDRFGNRRFDLANTTTPTAANGLPKVINPEIDPSNNRLKQTQYGEANVYLYDAAGNMTRDALGKQFIYDAENKQREVKDAGNVSLGTYVYDGDGKRIKKVTPSETTIFVYDASGKLAAEYQIGGAANPTPQTSYLTNDHLGSPRVITDQTGKVTSRRDFMAFGEDLSTPQRTPQLGYAADTTRQKFTGYEKDTESDLDYAQARYYNSKHGRFTTVDPLMASAQTGNPKTWNRYVYALNNPLRFVDPTGMSAQEGDCPTGATCKINPETGEEIIIGPTTTVDKDKPIDEEPSGAGGPALGMIGCFSEGCRRWASDCKSNPLACDISPGAGVLGGGAKAGGGFISRALSGIAKFFGFGGKKLLKPVGGVINVGGAGEVPSVTNVNALIDRTAQGIDNLVVADGAQIGNLFEAGSANSVIANRLPYGTVNWEGLAEGAHKVLGSGGTVQINVWTTGAQDLGRLESAFKAAGFRNVSVTGSGTGTIINAVR